MLTVKEAGLFDSDLTDPINLFLGSGFSTLARNRAGKCLPTGSELKTALIEKYSRQDLDQLDLQSVYTVIANEQKADVDELMINTFSVEKYNDKYDCLRQLSISHIYTTNIDDLPFKIFRPIMGEVSPLFHDVSRFGQPRDISASIQYIPLHGSITHEEPAFIFTSGQISSAFAADQQTWFVFQRELQRRPTFFLGYGMKDAGVLQALHNALLQRANRWILVTPGHPEAETLYESLGFHVLVGTIEDFLDTICERAKNRAAKGLAKSWAKLGSIPRSDEVAQRPVRDFFLGAEPGWSDAYSPQVQRRRVNDRVLDLALQGKNVAVIGLPLSGKSTIIRQSAADLMDKRSCIFFEKISAEIADEVIAEYDRATTKPIIIVDQFIDSRDGFNKLAAAGGFKFIVAESSVYFDSMNLKALEAPLSVVSCSEVDRADLQRIIESLPVDVRRRDVVYAEVQEQAEFLGLFEGLVRQVFDRDLTPRFRRRLKEFEQKDQQAFDVYLMTCYVNMCRTLVSYDMIHMFIGSKDYVEGYRVTARINEFVRERDDAEDQSQDHFSVRSGALARITMRECSRAAFGRVFDRFHRLIGPRVVPDYPTFRRYAYDNDFAIKAFPDFHDGKTFYERLFVKEDNAYDYQHGAVYMSKMRQHSLAFEWIDKALSKAGRRTFTIRNSHAVILFEANFEFYRVDPSDFTARDGIRKSMAVLESCIEQDNWRRYHLLRFADQAMKLAEVRMDDEVRAWLATARAKLEVALQEALKAGSRESYNASKYRRLLRTVERVHQTS